MIHVHCSQNRAERRSEGVVSSASKCRTCETSRSRHPEQSHARGLGELADKRVIVDPACNERLNVPGAAKSACQLAYIARDASPTLHAENDEVVEQTQALRTDAGVAGHRTESASGTSAAMRAVKADREW